MENENSTNSSKALYLKYIRDNGYPKIANRIDLLWGTPEMEKYFAEIVFLDTYPQRQGFPQDIFDMILKLSLLHH